MRSATAEQSGGYDLKTVLFALNSSYSHTNLAVRAIGAALADAGFETVVLEKNLKDPRLGVLYALYAERAGVYGFSVYIWNVREMLRIASELKSLLPEAAIVFGGPEVSFSDDGFFAEHPFVDFIIAGEGEEAFPALCRALERGESVPRLYRAAPFAAFASSGIYYDRIGDAPHGLVYYESVRGCPFSCSYCLSSIEEGIRAKSAEKALRDLLAFEVFDGIRTVKLVDRTFNFDRERAKMIWRGLADERYTKEYHFEVSAALLDEESFALLARVPKGKFRLEIGVQSTNPDTIRAVSRALDTEKTLAALKRLHAAGNLHIHADLIAGLPYEAFASFGRSFDAVYGHADVLQLGFLKLLRGSHLRESAADYGIRYSPEPPYQVLKTAALSFDDIMRLEGIESLVERFSNSGRFSYTFPYLPLAFGSAFGFFDRLCRFMEEAFGQEEISRLSQTEAFRLVMTFAEEASQNGISLDVRQIKERLALDFLLGESRRLPPFLSEVLAAAEEKARCLSGIPAYQRASSEVVKLTFLTDTPVVVNRAEHRVIGWDVAGDASV